MHSRILICLGARNSSPERTKAGCSGQLLLWAAVGKVLLSSTDCNQTLVHQHKITAQFGVSLKSCSLQGHFQSWTALKTGRHTAFLCDRRLVNRWVTRHQQPGTTNDKRRPGRPKAAAAAENYICVGSSAPRCTSAAEIAAKIQQALRLKCSPSSSHVF